VATEDGRVVCLHFPNKIAPETDNVEVFEELRGMASSVGAVGLERFADQAGV
jgi:hypothetical protein